MKTSPEGIKVMHHYEACVLHAYPDPASELGRAMLQAGLWFRFLRDEIKMADVPLKIRVLKGHPWTIGWGNTGPDVVPGMRITRADADARFERRLAQEFEPGVLSALTRPVAQHQFDALVCFAYNLGLPNFRGSTLRRMVNAGDFEGAALQFLLWNKANNVRMLGLTRRRNAEMWLFRGKPADDAIARASKIEVA